VIKKPSSSESNPKFNSLAKQLSSMPEKSKAKSTSEALQKIYKEKDNGKIHLISFMIYACYLIGYNILSVHTCMTSFKYSGLAISANEAELGERLDDLAIVLNLIDIQISSLINLALNERIQAKSKSYLSQYNLKARFYRARFKRRELAVILLLKSSKQFKDSEFQFSISNEVASSNWELLYK